MTTMKTQTLAEFLLARIVEDEARTWALSPYECEPGCCAPAGWIGSQCRFCDPAPVYGGTVEAVTSSAEEHAEAIHQRSRVLAECEAKRAVVREVTRLVPEDLSVNCPQTRILEALALPYADHPDYRQEWKP